MISYKKFEKIINKLKESDKFINELCDVLDTIDKFCDGSMHDVVIDLLENEFNDREDMLAYWVYDCNFGNDWTDESAIEKDGTPIDLRTTRQLYNYLVAHMNDKTEDEDDE